MKLRSFSSSIPLASITLCTFFAAVSGLHGASDTWAAAPANSTWTDPLNWVAATPPGATAGTTNTDTATFAVTSNSAVTVDAGRNLQNITFGTAPTTIYTLSAGSLLLTSGGTILGTGAGTGAGEQRISSALVLQGDGGTYRIQTDMPGVNREMIISGGITGASTGVNNTALTLAGSSAGSNSIATVIANGAGGGSLSLVKEGVGLWLLAPGANANTYSGGTTINAGTLRSESGGASTTALGSGTVTLNGGNLRFQSSTAANFVNPLSTTAGGGTISFRANSTFAPPSIASAASSILSVTTELNITVTTTNFFDYAGTLNLGNGVSNTFFRLGTGYVEASLANAALNLTAFSNVNRQVGTNGTLTTQIGSLSGAAGSAIGGSAAGNGTIVLTVGSRNEDSTFAGLIVNGGTKTGLNKVGTARLTLQGANTYTGATLVSSGILSLTSAFLADTAALTVASGATLNLNYSGSDIVGSLALGGSGPLPNGTYNSSTPTYGVFFSGTGSIQVGTSVSYDSFVASFGLQNPWQGVDPALNGNPSGDPDNDGQPNSLEYALGGSPVSGSNNPKIHTFTADSDVDADLIAELLMTIAVRDGTPAFSAGPAPTATLAGYSYTIQGSTTLISFDSPVTPTTAPVTTGLPAAPAGYNYRTFSLNGSNGLAGPGFMRVVVTN